MRQKCRPAVSAGWRLMSPLPTALRPQAHSPPTPGARGDSTGARAPPQTLEFRGLGPTAVPKHPLGDSEGLSP